MSKLNKDHETMFILFYLKSQAFKTKFIPLPIMAFSRSEYFFLQS